MNNNVHIPVCPELKNVIHSIWQVERQSMSLQEHIIPKGMIEVIFNFSKGGQIAACVGGKEYQLFRCFINGFNKSPVQLQLPEQQVFFGIQLQPLAVKRLFGTPASFFANTVVDITLLNPSFDSLWHQLAEQAGFDTRVKIFCNWVTSRCGEWLPQEQLLNKFLYITGQHDFSVKQLATSLCYSPRHVSRKIQETTGLNTEELLHYKKYLYAVHLMHYTDLNLTQIAYQSHFSDQSHFIRSFKGYAQMTPGTYRSNKSMVKGHLFENVR